MGAYPPRRSTSSQARRRPPSYRFPALAGALVLVAVLAFLATAALLTPSAGPSPAPVAAGTATATASGTGAAPSPSATPALSPSESSGPSPSGTGSGGPTPSSGPTATATASVRPSATPPASTPEPAVSTAPVATRSLYVTNGSRSSRKIALTFDFGGRVGDAVAIVDYLVESGVRATVFITGAQLDTTTSGPQVLELVCGRPDQFALGNHSYSHPSFDGIPAATMRTELARTEAAFARHCDRSPRPFFRPPNGALGGYRTATYYRILDTVGAAGYARTVTWDVDTLDWAAPDDPNGRYQTAAGILGRVESKATAGSIVLMHLGGYNTLDALPSVVAYLRGQGYELVTLHELLGV